MDLSISIVNTNNRLLLLDCLRSIFALQGDLALEVFVVDNASADGSAEAVAAEFPQVRLIRNATRHGFTFNNNQALAQATGRWVMILNEDTVILPADRAVTEATLQAMVAGERPLMSPARVAAFQGVGHGALQRLLAVADADEGIGAIGPQIFDLGGRIQYECAGRFPRWWSDLFAQARLDQRWPGHPLFGYRLMADWDHRSSRDVQVLSGCCMMVRGTVAAQVGFLDERFFIYAEDVDWCRRIYDAGWRIRFCADAQIIHLAHQSTRALKWTVEAAVSRYRYYLKHHGPAYALLYRIAVVPVIAARLLGGALSPAHRSHFRLAERIQGLVHLARLRSMVAP